MPAGLGCGCATEKHVHYLECPRLQPLWRKLARILEGARNKPFRNLSQAILFGWTTEEGRIEKGSIALFSMLLKIVHIEFRRHRQAHVLWAKLTALLFSYRPTDIEFYMVIHKSRAFDYAKVWRIFWARAKRQWDETARDKEYELRNISQRGSNTHTTWVGINKQLAPQLAQ